MKITKSELKQIIRESIREELAGKTLTEWVDTSGKKVNNSTSTTSTTASSSNTTKRRPLKTKDALKKLWLYLDAEYGIDQNYEYTRLHEAGMGACFTTNKKITYYLDVTTLGFSNGRVYEQWDFVLEELAPAKSVVKRGNISGYEQLIDILYSCGIVKDKNKCL